jgi:outer membrane protein assembly factor BamB
LKGGERVLCLDAASGAIVWTHEYPAEYRVMYPSGPRATPTVDGGRVYSLGAMGDLICLDAAKGTVLWARNVLKDFGGEINAWGYSSAPIVDGKKLIVIAGGRPNACVVALEKETGKEIWRALDADDFGYSTPEIFEAGGARQLIVWTPKALSSLDPETGKLHWEEPFALNSGLALASPILDARANRLFVTAFYNGPLMMQLAADKPEAKVLWKGKSSSEKETDGLHAIICTPAFKDDHIYGVCSYGQLRCLEEATGKRVWETLQATGSGRWWNAFLVRHEDRFFIANEQGDLIIASLSPAGYEEQSRAHLIDALQPIQRRKVVWSHPAFAGRCILARNDAEILCADLSAK